MKFIVTAKQMKNAENNAVRDGINTLTLMENAGAECFKKISEILGGVENKTFTVLCGSGNNGGDGIAVASHIKEHGGEPLCVFVESFPVTTESLNMYDKYCVPTGVPSTVYFQHETIVKQALQNCDVIIDAVFGIGFRGQLSPKTEKLFNIVNEECKSVKFSIDLPSGINSDTGIICQNCFKPDVTFVLDALKVGLLSHPAFDFCGNIVLLDVGIPQYCYNNFTACLTEDDILNYIPQREKSVNKGNFGKLLNIAGCERFMGSAILSSKAAYKSGAGLVTLASAANVCRSVATVLPEATFIPAFTDDRGYIDDDIIDELSTTIGIYSAIILGCGIGVTKYTKKVSEFVLKNAVCPIILDADGINSIVGNINILKDNDKPKILTPHPLEFSRLNGLSVKEIQSDRIRHTAEFAEQYKVTLVLKGVNTVVASPDGRIAINSTGNAGLAKAGAGDVLSGIIGGLSAQGLPPFESAVLGVYLHGLAADRLAESVALSGIMPSDVAEILPFIMKV